MKIIKIFAVCIAMIFGPSFSVLASDFREFEVCSIPHCIDEIRNKLNQEDIAAGTRLRLLQEISNYNNYTDESIIDEIAKVREKVPDYQRIKTIKNTSGKLCQKAVQEEIREQSYQLDKEYQELFPDIELKEKKIDIIQKILDLITKLNKGFKIQLVMLKKLCDEGCLCQQIYNHSNNNTKKILTIQEMVSAAQNNINNTKAQIQNIKTEIEKYKVMTTDKQPIDEDMFVRNYSIILTIKLHMLNVCQQYQYALIKIEYIKSVIQECITTSGLSANLNNNDKTNDIGRDFAQIQLNESAAGINTMLEYQKQQERQK